MLSRPLGAIRRSPTALYVRRVSAATRRFWSSTCKDCPSPIGTRPSVSTPVPFTSPGGSTRRPSPSWWRAGTSTRGGRPLPVGGGRWRTVQVFSNFPLTDDQAARLRAGVPADGYEVVGVVSSGSAPSTRFPTAGAPGGRVVGGQLPADEEPGKNESHPPTEAREGEEAAVEGVGGAEDPSGAAWQESSAGPEVAVAERVLLSLRHEQRQLHLGVPEARSIAGLAAEWLRRGVTTADLRRALCNGLPPQGVRTAVGFLAHRLKEKLPAAPRERGSAAAAPGATGPDRLRRARRGAPVPAPCAVGHHLWALPPGGAARLLGRCPGPGRCGP